MREVVQNKTGKNVGKRFVWFNGSRKDKVSGKLVEYPNPRFDRYQAEDFSRFCAAAALVAGDPEPTAMAEA